MNEASLIAQLLASLDERMERAAYRGTIRANGELSINDELDSAGAAKMLGKVHPDGTANMNALKQFMRRHAVPHSKPGGRLLFSRRALAQWIDERGTGKAR